MTPVIVGQPVADITVRIRRPCQYDRAALIGMHQRCGPVSRFQRWLGNVSELAPRYLDAVLAGTADHPALLAETCGESPEVVGLASAGRLPDATYDLGVLVEDRYQGHGIGTALCDQLIGALPVNSSLTADCLFENRRVLRHLAAYGEVRIGYEFGVAHGVVERSRSRLGTSANQR
jgi:GNAT superfamily N-acetyltransferase